MKKVILHLVFISYFISVMNMPEVYKSGYIIKHFIESRKENSHLSFTDFIIMHYITDDNNSSDNIQDQKLPFKSNSHLISDTITLSIHQQVNYAFQSSIIAIEKMQIFKSKFCLFYYLNSIWNPPKIGY